MAPRHETPRARRGGDPRAGGRSPRPSGDVCAEPSRLKGSPETQGVPSSGAGPSQNGTCSGGGVGRKSRAGKSAVNHFRFWRTRVSITPISLHREKIISGDKISIPLRWHKKIDPGSGLGEERWTPRATSRPLDHGRIHLISSRPSSTFTVALPDIKWVGGGLILGRDQRPIVA